MGAIGKYRTYGALIGDVQLRLVEASKRAKACHCGSPRFFRERTKAVHEAFEQFAAELGVTPAETARLRRVIAEQIAKHSMLSSLELEILSSQVPPEFCVRGEWVSPRASLTVH